MGYRGVFSLDRPPDKTPVKIRLYGIDCPEQRQAFGTRAKQFTSDLVFGKNVNVETVDVDRYGRIVGIVRLGLSCVLQEAHMPRMEDAGERGRCHKAGLVEG